jgi:hypothetical protein
MRAQNPCRTVLVAGIHYPTIIVEVTPDEYRRIQANDLELPSGWTIADEIPKATQEIEQ